MRFGGVQPVHRKECSGTLLRFNLFFPVVCGDEGPFKASGWREVEVEPLQDLSDAGESSLRGGTSVYADPQAVLKADCKTTKLDNHLLNDNSIADYHSTLPVHGHVSSNNQSILKKRSALKRISEWLGGDTGLDRGRSRSPSPMPPNVFNEVGMSVRISKQVKFSSQTQIDTEDTQREEITFTSTDDTIQCLCSAIHQAPAIHTCLGLLVGDGKMKHRVWIPRQAVPKSTQGIKPAQTVSLGEMLSSWPKPSQKERRKLSVILASSVLQLHETEWLRERWTKQDIFFIREPLGTGTRQNIDLNHPVVHQAFTTPAPPAPQHLAESLLVRCNKSLVCLGIVLIELCYWKDLHSLQNGNAGNRVADASAEYSIAAGMIDHLYDEAGFNYGESVRRCITGLDLRETQLECDEFKKEAYHKIVHPLEMDLVKFYGTSLATIFQKPM
ncbi:hypothetical protein BGX38DRAFT_1234672 [Terfezia claveryi]|nr:hypothetical protein BGX38DRAFT_1234672 [Terfezia claveryi]